jgi:hypothetical protein
MVQTDGRKDGRMDGRTNGWTDGRTDEFNRAIFFQKYVLKINEKKHILALDNSKIKIFSKF